MTYMINALVPVSFTVEADSEDEAVIKATTLKQYCMTSPDGNRIETTEEEQDKRDSIFPRYCANNCGSVLYKREQAERVKYTRNATGESWYDYVCKRDCEPQRATDPGPAL